MRYLVTWVTFDENLLYLHSGLVLLLESFTGNCYLHLRGRLTEVLLHAFPTSQMQSVSFTHPSSSSSSSSSDMPFSHHSHSGQFCGHATDTLEEMIQTAITRRMTVFALTEHMPREQADLYPDEASLPPPPSPGCWGTVQN